MEVLKKNQIANVGKYSYQYVDIAQIHEYLDSINSKYIQTIKTIDGNDYVMTKRCFDNKWEDEWLQGCRVVDATLMGVNNPAQQQGSALTYARRYSLLMAYGLATEDDDAQSLSTDKVYSKDDAEKYKLTFGKYKDRTLKEVYEEDYEYIEWLTKNTTSPEIAQYLELLFNMKKSDYEVSEEKMALTQEVVRLVDETGVDLDSIKDKYKISSLNSADETTLKSIKNKLDKLKETRAKAVAESE